MEMVYHFIRMNGLNMSAAETAEYSIHGLERSMIKAATQLNFERTTIENRATGTMVQKCLINTIRANVFMNECAEHKSSNNSFLGGNLLMVVNYPRNGF